MDLVKLATCSNNIEASSIQALLEASGIESYIQGENHRAMLGMMGAYIELRVMVAADDLEEARAVLAQAEPEPEPEPEPESGTRRRRIGTAVVVSVALTFGCGHFYAGAWLRGGTLAALELVAIALIASGVFKLGLGLVLLAICIDAVGSAVLIGEQNSKIG